MWQLPSWLLEAVAGTGALLFPSGLYAIYRTQGSWALRGVCGAIAFLGLGLMYSTLVPPYHAPDEPDHFFAFLTETAPELLGDARRLAQIGYFEEIRSHPHTKFKPEWRGRPSSHEMAPDFTATVMSARAPLTTWMWRKVSQLIFTRDVGKQLLFLRVFNAMLMSLAVGIGFAMTAWFAGTVSGDRGCCAGDAKPPRRESNSRRVKSKVRREKSQSENSKSGDSAVPAFRIAPLALLIAPTLPFFGMQVSNYPMLIAGGIVATAAAMGVFFGGRRDMWVGAVLGGSGFWMVFSGRAGFVYLAILLTAVLAATVTDGSRPASSKEWWRKRLSALGFWVLFGAVFVLMAYVLKGAFSLGFILDKLVPDLPASWQPGVAELLLSPWVLPVIPAVFFMLDSLLSLAQWVRFPRKPRLARLMAAPWCILVIAGFFGMLWGPNHHLISIEQVPTALIHVSPEVRAPLERIAAMPGATNAPTSWRYVKLVLVAFLGSQGLCNPDFYLVRYWWTGFGWLDTVPGGLAVALLMLPVFLGYALLWWDAYLHKGINAVLRLSIWNILALVYLALLAIGARREGMNLHGRYLSLLLAFYIPVCCSGLANFLHWPLLRRLFSKESTLVGALLCFSALAHGYCLWFIVDRYFGL